MNDLEEILRAEMVKYLVQKTIFCPNTGQLLDTGTCVILNDTDGDPIAVLSPAGWANISPNSRELLTERGITIDDRQAD